MIIAYIFEIAFVTLCFMACSCNSINFGKNYRISTICCELHKHVSRIQHLMSIFLDATIFFVLSINFASAIYSQRTMTLYKNKIMVLASILNREWYI